MVFGKKWHVRQVEDKDYIFIEAKVANPLEPKKAEKVEFLVDTGATGCAISSDLAEKLSLEASGTVDVGLADGSSKHVKAAYILIELAGRKLYTWAVYDKGFTPILGLDVMRILGVHVDVPERRVLVPYKSLKLRRIQLYMGLPAITYSFNVAWGGGRG
jgi:predicted aspartyl protease